MSTLFKDNTTLGVIVSRMQVPYLTESHKNLIRTIKNRHSKVLILLGVANDINYKNPLPFDLRRQMILPELGLNDMIMPLRDNEDNSAWVANLDGLIKANLLEGEHAILYGGRDSFIPFYQKENGFFRTQELLPEDNDSGTELRNLCTTKIPTYSRKVAEAMIWYLNKTN